MRKISKRSIAIAAAVVIATGGAGAAWAAWTLTGTGNTSASAATVVPLSIAESPVEGLSPGVTSNIKFVVTNTNKFPVRITGVNIKSVDGPGNCKPADNIETPDITVPDSLIVGAAGASAFQTTLTIPNAIKMKSSAGNGCQGASFSLALKVDAVTSS